MSAQGGSDPDVEPFHSPADPIVGPAEPVPANPMQPPLDEEVIAAWEKYAPGVDPYRPSDLTWDSYRTVFDIFGLDPNLPINAALVVRMFQAAVADLATIMQHLEQTRRLNRGGNSMCMDLLFKRLDAYKNNISGYAQLAYITQRKVTDVQNAENGMWRFIPLDTDEPESDFQKVLQFILTDCARNGWRRYRDNFMQPLEVEAKDEQGNLLLNDRGVPKLFRTCAWKVTQSIEEYVWSLTGYGAVHASLWFHMTKNGGEVIKKVIDYLKTSQEPQIPWLNPDRHIFSYTNGFFDVKQQLFFSYNDPRIDPHHANFPVACKHFNVTFDPLWLDKGAFADYLDVPTPTLDKVLHYQRLTENQIRWLLALIGRHFYDLGELDEHWQIFLFLKGMGNTGKSVILTEILQNFYEQQDVALIGNCIERQFGLGAIYDKFLAIADDIREDLQLDQSDFQNMASGGAISCAIKFKAPKPCPHWKVDITWAGNVVPSFHENAGSVARRWLVIPFSKLVQKTDPMIPTKIAQEMPAIMCKCNRAYHEMLRLYRNVGLWDILSKEFWDQRDQLTADTNALFNFLIAGPLVYAKPSGPNDENLSVEDREKAAAERKNKIYVPLNIFKGEFMRFCKESSLRPQQWSLTYCMGAMARKGLELDMRQLRKVYPRTGSGELKQIKGWVIGVDLQANAAQDEIISADDDESAAMDAAPAAAAADEPPQPPPAQRRYPEDPEPSPLPYKRQRT
jgi:hypothetical protein